MPVPAVPDRILVFLAENGRDWVADFEDDGDLLILMSTTVVPTPFALPTPVDEVVRALQAQFPEREVVAREAGGAEQPPA